MKSKQLPFFVLTLLVVLAMIAGAYPTAAQGGLVINSVQPGTVSNVTSVNLVVTGSGFVDGAVVLLENFGALDTTFVSDTVLHAALPAGLAPGSYTVTVVNPDSTSASLPGALTVSEPTATTQPPTQTPPSEATPTPSVRPLLVIESYGTDVEKITPGKAFELSIKLKNVGGRSATNIVAVFTPGDFIPRESGGVLAVSHIESGDSKRIKQPLTVSSDLSGKTLGTLVMTVNYTDSSGTAYTETFNLTLPVIAPVYGPGPTATPTPTPTSAAVNRPQLVITGYSEDQNTLQPGRHFSLNLQINNLGNSTAKRVSMILGGGSGSSGSVDGTPTVGGVSGGSGDFGTFAPVASSNVQFLGDVNAGSALQATARLIVNATANPGAYPMKISFAYVDEKGNQYTDDQVITLLVYSLPVVDVNFYRQPDPLFTGQPGILPLQVVNLGRKTAVLGNMKVMTEGAELTNNTILVGALDIGGYYTLDTTAMPFVPGPLSLTITIDYTDDFNQPQVITRTLTLDVQEMIIPEPIPGEGGVDGGEGFPLPEPETFWQKVWRFVRGLLGLDSGQQQPAQPEIFPEEIPSDGGSSPGKPLPAPAVGPKG
jgi:hypothetical protein